MTTHTSPALALTMPAPVFARGARVVYARQTATVTHGNGPSAWVPDGHHMVTIAYDKPVRGTRSVYVYASDLIAI